MTHTKDTTRIAPRRFPITHNADRVVFGALWVLALAVTVTSAIWTKERGALPALAMTTNDRSSMIESSARIIRTPQPLITEVALTTPAPQPELISEPEPEVIVIDDPEIVAQFESGTRWFDGKPVRPARIIMMKVTGYSPDARSCGIYADGKTATLKSVWTNGMRLVAADPKVLPYWSMVSVPGYADDEIVPVLDCGGAIKGNELDLLFPTHEIALRWGVRMVPVTVWDYVDEQ